MMLLSTKPKAAAVSKAAARQAGLLELLLHQMKLWGESEQEESGVTTVSYAALALSRLVAGSEKNHELLREHGGLELLVQLLWAYHVQVCVEICRARKLPHAQWRDSPLFALKGRAARARRLFPKLPR